MRASHTSFLATRRQSAPLRSQSRALRSPLPIVSASRFEVGNPRFADRRRIEGGRIGDFPAVAFDEQARASRCRRTTNE